MAMATITLDTNKLLEQNGKALMNPTPILVKLQALLLLQHLQKARTVEVLYISTPLYQQISFLSAIF